MEKITKFTGENVKTLMDKFHKAMDVFCKENGVEYSTPKQLGYLEDEFSFKLKFLPSLDETSKEEKEKKEFELYAKSYGLDPSNYLFSWEEDGKILTLYGFNHRAKKNTCLLRDNDGNEYSTSISSIKSEIVKNIVKKNIAKGKTSPKDVSPIEIIKRIDESAKKEFDRDKMYYNLENVEFMQELIIRNEPYYIYGFCGTEKFPYTLIKKDGGRYNFNKDAVMNALGKN